MNKDKSLAPRTKTDRLNHLDTVREELGELTLTALTAPKARSFLLTGRDKRANTDAVREVLDSLERGSCPTVLATSEGEPWTPPGRGLDSGVQRARDDADDADEAARKRAAPDATAGLDGLRFHDLRGTGCRWTTRRRFWAGS